MGIWTLIGAAIIFGAGFYCGKHGFGWVIDLYDWAKSKITKQ